MNTLLPPKFQFREIPWNSPIHPRHGKYNEVGKNTACRTESALGKVAPDIRKEPLEPGEPK